MSQSFYRRQVVKALDECIEEIIENAFAAVDEAIGRSREDMRDMHADARFRDALREYIQPRIHL